MLGTSLMWRPTVAFTYLKLKWTKCLCLLPMVLVLCVLQCRNWPIYVKRCQGPSRIGALLGPRVVTGACLAHYKQVPTPHGLPMPRLIDLIGQTVQACVQGDLPDNWVPVVAPSKVAPRHRELSRFYWVPMTSYWRSIATMGVSCIVSKI